MMTSTMGLQQQASSSSSPDTVDYAGYLQHRQHRGLLHHGRAEQRPMQQQQQQQQPDQNASFTSAKGLLNGPGQNNCFLNSAVQAQLLQNGGQICGASIISNTWILTAAHCIVESSPEWSVLTGSSSVSTGGQRHEVEEVIVHSDYDTNTADNDIALIKLKKPIVFNERQKPIPLSDRVPQTGEKMTISGFGKLGESLDYAKILQTANVPIIDHDFCKKQYNKDPITDNMFCAGRGPTDACQGDSGGPGVINGELVGVVSAGMECGSMKYPGIYAIVANYRKWIDSHVNKRKSLLGNSFLFRPHKNILGQIVDGFIGIGR